MNTALKTRSGPFEFMGEGCIFAHPIAMEDVLEQVKTGSEMRPTLSPARRRIYTLIVILIPPVIMGVTEAILRAMSYGGNSDLVITTDFGGREHYRINRTVAQRYFAHSVKAIPEMSEDVFEIRKRRNTIRIFCLGESTMAGFPYEFHATVPSLLKDRLAPLLPDHHLEIINVGLAAVGSFVVADFIDELAAYQPDLYVLYVGHNEFYGAFGVCSTVGVSGGAWMTRLHLSLLKFKTYQFLRDAVASLRSIGATGTTPAGTLMGQMAGERLAPYHGDSYNSARAIYRENLEQIIGSARRQDVPILFTALVSNLKDREPFVPHFSASTSDAGRTRCRELLARSDSLLASGQAAPAEQTARQALTLDSTYASTHYTLGRIHLAQRRVADARWRFALARDYDALRFRASGEFEDDLIALCREHRIPVARVDSAFAGASPDGVTGSGLMLEHVHPNLGGYFLMAKTIASAIRNSFVRTNVSWMDDGALPDSVLLELSTVSSFDSIAGRIKTDLLMQRWPFTAETGGGRFVPGNPAEEIVYRYVRGGLPWSEARYALAEYFAGIRRHDLARRECLAVAKVLSFSYQPLLKVADYYRDEGKNPEAMRAYERCLQVEENPFARMKLAIMLLEEGQSAEAEQEIVRAFATAQRGPHRLSATASASGRYLLAVALAQQQKYREARENLHHALTLQPDHREAAGLLRQLEEMKAE